MRVIGTWIICLLYVSIRLGLDVMRRRIINMLIFLQEYRCWLYLLFTIRRFTASIVSIFTCSMALHGRSDEYVYLLRIVSLAYVPWFFATTNQKTKEYSVEKCKFTLSDLFLTIFDGGAFRNCLNAWKLHGFCVSHIPFYHSKKFMVFGFVLSDWRSENWDYNRVFNFDYYCRWLAISHRKVFEKEISNASRML